MQIQSCFGFVRRRLVVICFKFSNFAYANTVSMDHRPIVHMLLFALNLVTLLMQIQFTTCSIALYYALLFALNLVTLLMQIQL